MRNSEIITTQKSDVFHAIADTNRRKILDLLQEEEMPVQNLASHFDISFQAISQHLHILAEAGLVSRRKQGRFRIYQAKPDALREVYEWITHYRQFWESSLERLGTYLTEREENGEN